jgi:hypothetical protein
MLNFLISSLATIAADSGDLSLIKSSNSSLNSSLAAPNS